MAMDETLRDARAVLDTATAAQIAEVYGDNVVFPEQVVIDQFPGWPSNVLVLAHENQGVCSWGLSLGDVSEGVVVVAGDLAGGADSVAYCDDLETYVAARRWDDHCLRPPLLQAQAAPVDADCVEYLDRHFDRRWITRGWPCRENLRFERDDLRVMLWSCADQCDWWISGSAPALAAVLDDLSALSDLGTALWSNDTVGEDLLRTHLRAGNGP